MESFQQFAEAMEPRHTRYGANKAMDDGEFKDLPSIAGDAKATFFEHNNAFFVVMIGSDGEVVFGQSSERSTDIDHYNLDRVDTRNALTIFNKVFYVVTEMINRAMPNQRIIEFVAVNSALERVYQKMVNNDSFRQAIKKLGVRFLEKDGKKYVFARSV